MEWTLDDVRSAAAWLYEFQAEHAERTAALAQHVAVPPAGEDEASAAQARLVSSSIAAHYAAHQEANPKLGAAAEALLAAADKAHRTDSENAALLGGAPAEDSRAAPPAAVPALPDAPAPANIAGTRPSGGEEAAALVRSGAGNAPLRAAGEALAAHAQFCEDGVERLGSIRARVRSGMADKTGELVDAQLRGYQTWLSEQPAGLRAAAGKAGSAADSHQRVVGNTHDPQTLAEARDRVLRVSADYRSGKSTESELTATKAEYRELVDHNRDVYGRHAAATPAAAEVGPEPAPHIVNPAAADNGTPGRDPWSLSDPDLDELDQEDGDESGDGSEKDDDKDSKEAQQLGQVASELASALGQGVGAIGQAVTGAIGQGVGAIGQAGQGAASAVQSLASAPATAKRAKGLDDLDDDFDDGLDGLGDLGDLSASTSPMGAAGGPGGAAIALGTAGGDTFDGPAVRAGFAPAPVAAPAPAGGPSSMMAPPMMGPAQKQDEKEHKRQKELAWKDAGMNLDELVPAAGPSMIGSPAPADNGAAGGGTKEGTATP